MTCLLREGLSSDGEASREEFDRVLAEVDIADSGWRLGQYEVLGEIGRGGMGVIYRAQQRHSRRMVAVKRLLRYEGSSRETLERFRREAEAAASLDHPNILPIYEVSQGDDGLPFYSMKLAPGGSLAGIAMEFQHDRPRAARLMAKVARAVDYAHRRGILHRDLQPGNILRDVHGEPMVSDFGLAKWLGQETDLTRTLTAFGTPGYIAPEQSETGTAALGPATDIYSLGAVLFYLLAGRPPFTGPNAITVIRQAAETPAPRLRSLVPSVDRDLETIVARCLERDPHARYASAGEVADDLERWLEHRPIQARPVSYTTRLWRSSRRNPHLAWAIAGCVLLGAAFIALLDTHLERESVSDERAKSIAVLPFENLSHNQDEAFFADGMQEEILTDLGKLADLRVISRSSVVDFKPGPSRDLRQIGAALGARHLLEGSVQRAAGRVRISARLTDAQSGTQLWAEQYERELRDVFAIQREIAREIAGRLRATLSPKEQATLDAIPTRDLLAYDLYLQAQAIGRRAGLSTAERTEQQVSLLNQAVARDPAFVPALCLLARVHVFSYWSNHDHTPARLEAARKALHAAVQLQPDGPQVHLTRGVVHYWGSRDYVPALTQLARARRDLPNEAEIPYFMGLIARRQGDWEVSTRYLEEARMMDPRNTGALFDLARTNYFALKRYADAAATIDSVLEWTSTPFDFQLARAKVDLASRADLAPLQKLLWGETAGGAERELLVFERLELALAERNYRAAEAALATQRLPEFNWSGYVTPREWYAGVIAQGLGDLEKAQSAFSAARQLLLAIAAERPDDAKAQIVLAEVEARLGHKEEAIGAGERALILRPVSNDAVDGAHLTGRLAGVYAQVGEIDRALTILEEAAKLRNGPNYGELKLDAVWDPLRGDPRFEKIVASLAPAPR